VENGRLGLGDAPLAYLLEVSLALSVKVEEKDFKKNSSSRRAQHDPLP